MREDYGSEKSTDAANQQSRYEREQATKSQVYRPVQYVQPAQSEGSNVLNGLVIAGSILFIGAVLLVGGVLLVGTAATVVAVKTSERVPEIRAKMEEDRKDRLLEARLEWESRKVSIALSLERGRLERKIESTHQARLRAIDSDYEGDDARTEEAYQNAVKALDEFDIKNPTVVSM